MSNTIDKEKFLEIIKNATLLQDDAKPLFAVDIKYKELIQSVIERAEENAQEAIFDDTYRLKQQDGKLLFRLVPSNIKRKYPDGLDLAFFVSQKSFLEKSGFEPLKKETFVFEQKENLKEFLECYNFYIELIEFLKSLEVHSDNLNKTITIYFQQPITISTDIERLECDGTANKKRLLERIQEELTNSSPVDKQTKKEFFKKAIADSFRNKKEINLTDIFASLSSIYTEYEIIKRAYIDSLDTDKIKEDFKNKYQETLNFLNTIISNLYTKTLFIPITIIFGISQKLSTKDLSNQFYIFLSLVFFLLILAYLIVGSINVLKNIKIQIDDLQEETKAIPTYDKKMRSIYNLYKGVRNRIYGIAATVIAAILILSYIYAPAIKAVEVFK